MSEDNRGYYQILGVNTDATRGKITQAFCDIVDLCILRQSAFDERRMVEALVVLLDPDWKDWYRAWGCWPGSQGAHTAFEKDCALAAMLIEKRRGELSPVEQARDILAQNPCAIPWNFDYKPAEERWKPAPKLSVLERMLKSIRKK